MTNDRLDPTGERSERQDGFDQNDEPREQAAQIERDIEQTRRRMTDSIDTLGEKLSPQRLKEQAQEAIAEKAHEVVAGIGDQALKTGDRIIGFVADNPLPVAAATLGALWLFTKRSRSGVSGDRMARFAYTGPERRTGKLGAADATARVGNAVRQTRERAGDFIENTKEGLKDMEGRVEEQAQRARGEISRLVEEQPLVIMAGTAILGMALGSLLPGTRGEDQLMGRARDAVVDRAESAARRVKAAAVDAGREVADVVQDQIADKGPEVKGALHDAADEIGKKVNESASRLKDATNNV